MFVHQATATRIEQQQQQRGQRGSARLSSGGQQRKRAGFQIYIFKINKKEVNGYMNTSARQTG